VIAALYHDAVYFPGRSGTAAIDARRADPRLAQCDDGWRVLPAAVTERATGDVLHVFSAGGSATW